MHRHSWYLALTVWCLWAIGVANFVPLEQLLEHILIAPTMLVGSFIAGSTSAGGGAVAFPVMTLIFEVPPPVARDFSLMIQSVGMGAASVGILFSKTEIDWRVITLSNIGGFFGLLIGMRLAQSLSPPVTKMFFVSLWLSLGVALHLVNRSRDERVTKLDHRRRSLTASLLVAGVLGGTISGITGSGLDMLTFAVITIAYRLSETIATPTSVVIMAINAIVGVSIRWIESEWIGNVFFADASLSKALAFWWSAVPVVVVGAPMGAWFIRNKDRRFIVRLLYIAIAAQFIGAIWIVPQTARSVALTIIVTTVGSVAFWAMSLAGRRRT